MTQFVYFFMGWTFLWLLQTPPAPSSEVLLPLATLMLWIALAIIDSLIKKAAQIKRNA